MDERVLIGMHYRENDTAPIRVLASDMPSINGVGFDARNGKLYVSQTANTGPNDAMWEIDHTGATQPRLIARGIGSLNGFKVGPAGMLYGALMFRGQAAKADPANGKVTETVTKQLKPTIDNMAISPDGTIYVSNMADNSVEAFEPSTGETRVRSA